MSTAVYSHFYFYLLHDHVMESKKRDRQKMAAEEQRQQPLAASEYPCNLQSCNDTTMDNPTVNFDALRNNSIHKWTLSTRTIAHYCRLEQIGEGTYGQVYRATCLTPTLNHPRGGEVVAMKKIRLQHPGYWGIPPTVIREIKILKELQHKNMLKMFEVATSKGVEELDWEDEREDDRRKKEAKDTAASSAIVNSTPMNSDENDSLLTDANRLESATKDKKKKKKDPLSDIEKLRESYKGNLFLVLEYVSHDLTGLLDMAFRFSEVQVKSITKQLLEVLDFMHQRDYVHRDLKTSNILITDKFEVKLADFGLARCLKDSRVFVGDSSGQKSNNPEFTNKVITLWYRPPELLLGETCYGTAVDLWSAGCILAEIILGRPIFTGKTEIDQLKLIFDIVGTPTKESWEGFNKLKLIRTGEVTIGKAKQFRLREKYAEKFTERMQPSSALSLLEKLLELNPTRRFTAKNALGHRYFQTEPMAPEDPRALGRIDIGGEAGFHEFQTKKRRREAKVVAKKAEEDAKGKGKSSDQQKEAFDEAYRQYLATGGLETNKTQRPKKRMPR